MPVLVHNLIYENEAVQNQVGFVKSCVKGWKSDADPETLTQLIHTTYYLREGLKDLYEQEDGLLLPQLDISTSEQIQSKHEVVIKSLDKIYRLLIDLNPEGIEVNKEHLVRSIDHVCQLITLLSIQENGILKSRIN